MDRISAHPDLQPVAEADLALLGQTAEQYAAACVAAGMRGGRAGALERYTAAMRSGRFDDPLARVTLPPIVRTHTSECGEGTTLKFTQAVAPAARKPQPPQATQTDPSKASLALPVAGTPTPPASLETESVLIPMIGRKGRRTYTLCVSSQVGCAMGCTFCQTAQLGLVRHLSAAEIVGQVMAATHVLKHEVSNIVFMGMGEPLDNYENVVRAIDVLRDHRGLAVPVSKITISTVGRIDGIRRLAEQIREPGWHRLNLAISLNAPSDEIRSSIMPINRAMPLADLRRAFEAWPVYGGFKFCFEYVLIPGVNDRPEHARMLAAFLQGDAYTGPETDLASGAAIRRFAGPELWGLVNVIPYNPREHSPWAAPTEASVDQFMLRLQELGLYAKRRRTKGRDQMAACGQLGNLEYRRRRSGAIASFNT